MINKVFRKAKGYGRVLLPIHAPDFIVIGGQKCGTTSIHYYLDQHPGLIGSIPKELHYFDRDYHFGKSFKDYKAAFRGLGKKHYFESTPAYLYHPQAPQIIKDCFPSVKMIALLRDPVKRAYSAWNHYRSRFESEHYIKEIKERPRLEGNLLYDKFFKDREVFPTFRECIDIELDLMEKGEGFEPALLRKGIYLEQLERYWQYFDNNQIMIIGFKDFVSDIPGTLKQVSSFVGAKEISWEQLNPEPRNQRDYSEPVRQEDNAFLEEFFEEPNRLLFEKIGKVNW